LDTICKKNIAFKRLLEIKSKRISADNNKYDKMISDIMNDINEHFPRWNSISWDKNLHDFHIRKLQNGDKISQEEFFKALKINGGSNMQIKSIMAQSLSNNDISASLEYKDVNRFENYFGKDYIKTIKLFSQFPNEYCFRGFITGAQAKDFIRCNLLSNPGNVGTYVMRCSESMAGWIVFCVRVDEKIKNRLNYKDDKEDTFEFRAELQTDGKYKFGEKNFELHEIFKGFDWLLQKPYSKYKSYPSNQPNLNVSDTLNSPERPANPNTTNSPEIINLIKNVEIIKLTTEAIKKNTADIISTTGASN